MHMLPTTAIAAVSAVLASTLALPAFASGPKTPASQAQPLPAAAYDWSGFYLGVHAGYGVAPNAFNSTIPQNNAGIVSVAAESFTLAPRGWVLGGQAGYNWHLSPSVVAGIEGDLAWSNQRDSLCVFNCSAINWQRTTQSLDWLATLRARIGYAQGGWLWYATGGAAWGRVNEDSTLRYVEPVTQTLARTQGGWTAGAGVEVVLGGHWTGKLEYLYVDLGRTSSSDTRATSLAGRSRTFALAGEFQDHIIRAGLNYNFGASRNARATQPGVAPAYHWAGLYVGGNAGYGVAHNPTTAGILTQQQVSLAPQGALGGVQAGYNWQLNRNFVAGVEADAILTSQSDSFCVSYCTSVPQQLIGISAVGVAQRLQWLATARVRAGYASGNWLAYLTGGAAWGEVKTSNISRLPGGSGALDQTHAQSGWAFGGGVETALGAGWTTKLEYLYVDLGSYTDTFLIPAVALTTTVHTEVRDHIVRLGVNYKFGG